MSIKEAATMPEAYERERRIRAEFRIKSQNHLVGMNHWQTCLNCEHWNSNINVCRYYEALPPPHIIIVGCEMHDFDIPF